jgi:hypothetical protein
MRLSGLALPDSGETPNRASEPLMTPGAERAVRHAAYRGGSRRLRREGRRGGLVVP